ncbi:MAG: NAD(P)-dependent oxidoreductase [Cytophagales bacterium]|nr:NAD(P)-dependent oxidoreductase [Armatimonadota bacterium]
MTGAGGFVGSSLTRLLVEAGCKVHAVVRPGGDIRRLSALRDQISLLEADLFDLTAICSIVQQVRPELCFHLAWHLDKGNGQLNFEANSASLVSSLQLATCLAKTECRRLIVTGSCLEYKRGLGYLRETSATEPWSPYAAAKIALYTMLTALASTSAMELAWARLFYLYGPGEDERRLVPSVIRSLLRGETAKTTPGGQVYDYLHVEDAAAALWAIAQSEICGPVNIGSGIPVVVKDLIIRIGQIMDREDLLQIGQLHYRGDEPMFVCADNQILRTGTQWIPRFDLFEGLEQTIRWWRASESLAFRQPELAHS